jgi:hypothetical protein
MCRQFYRLSVPIGCAMIDNKLRHSIGLPGRVKQASLLSNEVHPA